MRRLCLIWATVGASCICAACGGDSELDGRQLSSLSDDEWGQVCAQRAPATMEEQRGLAAVPCLIQELYSPSCDATRLASCFADLLERVSESSGCVFPDPDDPLRSCDATVAELDGCVTVRLATMGEFSNPMCADLTDLQQVIENAPSECAIVEDRCPDVDLW